MPKQIRVCCGRRCIEGGAAGIMQRLEQNFGLSSPGQNEQVDLDFCSCTGYCEQGPNVVINEEFIITSATPGTITEKITREEQIKMVTPDFESIQHNDFLGDLL